MEGDRLIDAFEGRPSSNGHTRYRHREPAPRIIESQQIVYFDASKNAYWICDGADEWFTVKKGDLCLRLRREGLLDSPRCENGLSQIDNELLRIQEKKRIEWAGKLAGYQAGLHNIIEQQILVTKGPTIVEPRDVPWPNLKNLMGELFGEELLRVFGWLRSARAALKAGPPWRPGNALVLCGPAKCGKSLFQDLITELLGNRIARPYRYMKDRTQFNADLMASEHLMIEDENPSKDIHSRRTFGAYLKNVVANATQSFHPKGKDALTLKPFWRVTISLNDDLEDMMVLPPMEESIAEKILLLRCFRASFPDSSRSLKKWHRFRETLSAELPGLLHFLRNWKLPKELQCNRYGVASWQDPSLIKELAKISPEESLYELILSAGVLPDRDDFWRGTAHELKEKLLDKYKRDELGKLLSFPAAMGNLLGRLARQRPDCVQKDGFDENRIQVWRVAKGGLKELGTPPE